MLEHVKLGSQGLKVPVMGLGAMGMSAFYGGRDDTESIATIHRSLELGINFIDTAEAYGPFKNEQLIAKAVEAAEEKHHRDEIRHRVHRRRSLQGP